MTSPVKFFLKETSLTAFGLNDFTAGQEDSPYCYFSWMGNGACEPECNTEANFWDLGDCCIPTSMVSMFNRSRWGKDTRVPIQRGTKFHKSRKNQFQVGEDSVCVDLIQANSSYGAHAQNCSCHATNHTIETIETIGRTRGAKFSLSSWHC